jgi:tetratricopeptide (TPR) repeat protein
MAGATAPGREDSMRDGADHAGRRATLAVLGCTLVLGGCASAPLRRADVASLAAADALVRQGCYECLIEARDTYERVAAGKKARPTVLPRLFEATVLVALRERELAIDNRPAYEKAKALAAELPASLGAAAALEIADGVAGHEAGWSRRRLDAFRREHRLAPEELETRAKAIETCRLSPLFRQYLSASLVCSQWRVGRVRERPQGANLPAERERRLPEVPPDAPPLLRYRLATCVGAFPKPLEEVRAEVPRFVESALFLGRLELKNAPKDGGRRARALLEEAYRHFPSSPAVTFLRGGASQAAGDYAAALRYFDETLALEQDHEDALFGRTVCLSHLGRHREAVAAATRVIELRTFDVGDAYYWRAWNHHKLAELTEARADIEEARKLRVNVGVLTLAGIIEYDQDDLDPAEKDLAMAVDFDPTHCPALWYQGLVQIRRKAWGRAAGHFASATGCYDGEARADERRRDAMRNDPNVDEDFRARQIEGFEAAMREDLSQASASAFNAAVNYLRDGDVARASGCADRAAEDPERVAKVDELRRLIAERKR